MEGQWGEVPLWMGGKDGSENGGENPGNTWPKGVGMLLGSTTTWQNHTYLVQSLVRT